MNDIMILAQFQRLRTFTSISMSQRPEIIASGYIRELQRTVKIEIPNDILLIIILFYPKCIEFEGNTLNLTLAEKQMITSWLVDVLDLTAESSTILTSKLLYNYNKDIQTSDGFHNKCDGNINTFSMIETKWNDKSHVFGCFLSSKVENVTHSSNWHGDWTADDKAFACVIRSCFKAEDLGPAIFKIKKDKIAQAYYGWDEVGIAFGSSDITVLWDINNSCNHSSTIFEGDLFGNRLCGGDKYDKTNTEYPFDIQQLNTYTIKMSE